MSNNNNSNMGYIEDHSRTIIHIDLDCFYAQVEMIKNPNLKQVPLGIQQKNIVVTSNYLAREFGVKKCMFVSEAKKLCPDLTLVRGEDLYDYRQTSYKVTNLLQQYSSTVERLGLDENFIDVSTIVNERLNVAQSKNVTHAGHVFGDNGEPCDCGCEIRLKIGTNIAQEIRDEIHDKLGLTSCAGISHNKLLSKIVGSRHKPNQQTVVFPNSVTELMLSLGEIKNIPGIGKTVSEMLERIGVKSVADLQKTGLNRLQNILGLEKGQLIYNSSFGIDCLPVKNTGRPQSIGLEDSCRTISVEKEVEEKLSQLLNRLLILVNEDGRIPRTIKLTIRKYDKDTQMSHRETKQCNINPSLFNPQQSSFSQVNNNCSKIISVVMNLFTKLVNNKKPYHITLLGLSFTKFQEKNDPRKSIQSFLRKDIEVQSITSIENLEESTSSTSCNSTISTLNYKTSNLNLEPNPKRSKLTLVSKRRCTDDEEVGECSSPSHLPLDNLNFYSSTERPETPVFNCPPNYDENVFKELPHEIQKELWDEYKRDNAPESHGSRPKKSKPNTLLNYFSKN